MRRRCAECRHAPSAHGDDGCRFCGCSSWLDKKRHVWREDCTDAWMLATEAWFLQAERVALGYETELREYEEKHPRPRLADFMRGLSLKQPIEILEHLLRRSQPCDHCHGTGHKDAA